MNERITKLKKIMEQEKIDHVLITDYYNLKYFINLELDPGERMIVLLVSKNKENILFINELFSIPSSKNYKNIYYNDTDDCISLLSSHLSGKSIYIDGKWTASFLLKLMNRFSANYKDASHLITKLRAIKDSKEIELMLKASLNNDEVMKKIFPYIKLGISEKEIHNHLLLEFKKLTPEPVPFDPIVAFGKNASNPHHISDNTILQKGDVCLIDMGCRHQGYCSDMTRTFLQKNEKMEEIYEIVKNANRLAIEAIKPGKRFSEIDKVARDYISSFGYGQYFTHRLGHGIGLEIHEGYDVSSTSEILIEEGMCFSIEPGIYLPDVGGVRIEDLVVVSKKGVIILNSFPKEKQFIFKGLSYR
ncbi:MAG: aminopeptidase P family protein [Erysipelotrichia bacterium]|nr:aminopeptidase P family protein [Erysipelotrichia bacterium]